MVLPATPPMTTTACLAGCSPKPPPKLLPVSNQNQGSQTYRFVSQCSWSGPIDTAFATKQNVHIRIIFGRFWYRHMQVTPLTIPIETRRGAAAGKREWNGADVFHERRSRCLLY